MRITSHYSSQKHLTSGLVVQELLTTTTTTTNTTTGDNGEIIPLRRKGKNKSKQSYKLHIHFSRGNHHYANANLHILQIDILKAFNSPSNYP